MFASQYGVISSGTSSFVFAASPSCGQATKPECGRMNAASAAGESRHAVSNGLRARRQHRDVLRAPRLAAGGEGFEGGRRRQAVDAEQAPGACRPITWMMPGRTEIDALAGADNVRVAIEMHPAQPGVLGRHADELVALVGATSTVI